MVYNENVTSEFAELLKRMMAKRPQDRPASVWDFLKAYRVTKIFRKPPRLPEVTVFDDIPSFKSPEQLTNKGKPESNG